MARKSDPDPKYTVLGISDICSRLNRSKPFVYWLINRGHLKAWKSHDRWETTEADLRAYIDKYRKGITK